MPVGCHQPTSQAPGTAYHQPTAGIIDRQNAKTTDRGGMHGCDGGKNISGRKRYLLVDRPKLVLCAQVHAADVAGRGGAGPLLEAAAKRLRQAAAPVGADAGYYGRRWGRYPEGVEPPSVSAFTVLKRRWVVERTFAWLGNDRRLSKDHEFLPAMGESLIYLAMSRLMLRLCRPDDDA